MRIKELLSKSISQAINIPHEDIISVLAAPPDSQLGDIAFPCFKLGGNPHEAAKRLKDKILLPSGFEKCEISGGYLNFFIDYENYGQKIIEEITRRRHKYGSSALGHGKTIVIDYCSVNIAKPYGIGHLRSTIIGRSLYNAYSCLGYKVVGINHLGDWGTQFGKMIIAFQRWGNIPDLKKDPIAYLLDLYVRFHNEASADPTLEDLGRSAFRKLEEGDKECLRLWKLFKTLSLQEFERLNRLLEVRFDSYNGEQFYNNLIEPAIAQLQKKVKTEYSSGALIVNLEKYNLPPLLLRKSNESSTYHTRDIAAAFYRLKTYKPDLIIYVVGSEQKLHFQQLFRTLELAGEDPRRFIHVDFGLYQFPEGKMSTRRGKVIFLEDVLNKSIDLAGRIIEQKNPGLRNKKAAARFVGVGAIIFGDLVTERTRNIHFDWDKILSFDGETGPYVQYTHARACSILRRAPPIKAAKGRSGRLDYALLSTDSEKRIIYLLGSYPEVIEDLAFHQRPHVLCRYLLDLSQAFNEFYHSEPVISDNHPVMHVRIRLVASVRQVLENGLRCLGIHAPKQM